MKSVINNNKFAVFIIIIIVIGLFLHYEMGYKLDLFTVGGQRHRRPRWKWNHPHYNTYKNVYHPWNHTSYSTYTHPQNVAIKKEDLFNRYDSNNDGNIDPGEFSTALEGDLKNKMNDKNTYTFY